VTQPTSQTAAHTFGPGELLVIAFPQERIPAAVISAVRDVITDGVVTLLDLTLVRRPADGGMEIVEVESLQETDTDFDLIVTEVSAPPGWSVTRISPRSSTPSSPEHRRWSCSWNTPGPAPSPPPSATQAPCWSAPNASAPRS
jgi:Family of unknown function (DUF6325)